MSYDINIWSVNSIDNSKQLLLGDGFKELSENRFSLVAKNWLINLQQSVVEDEDIPNEVLSLLPGVKYIQELHVEGSPPQTAYNRLHQLTKIIALHTTGVIENKQKDNYSLPSGIKKYNSPTREKNERFSILEISWWFEHKYFNNRERIVSLLKLLERYLPEALPRRYGICEPPQFKYEETGFEHLVDFLAGEKLFAVCYPTKPVLSIHFGFNEAPGFVKGWDEKAYKCSQIEISLDAAVLNQPHWQEYLPKIWKALSAEIQPFYGDVRILKNYISKKVSYWTDGRSESHPVKSGWWRGIPEPAPLAMVVGRPYTKLWAGIGPATDQKNDLSFYSAVSWSAEQTIENMTGPIPIDIAQPEPERLAASFPFE